MARFDLVVLSRCTPGEEAAYEDWYANQHLPDVCRIDGVVSARLTKVRYQKDYDLNCPPYGYLTIYEMDGEDPNKIMESILAVSGTDARIGRVDKNIPTMSSTPSTSGDRPDIVTPKIASCESVWCATVSAQAP